MIIRYKNNVIEKICNDDRKMDTFFGHDKQLVQALKVLMTILKLESNINCFHEERYKGYNYEPCHGEDNKYSMRIIPKKDKSPYRMYLEPRNGGVEINIIKIDKHTYRLH